MKMTHSNQFSFCPKRLKFSKVGLSPPVALSMEKKLIVRWLVDFKSFSRLKIFPKLVPCIYENVKSEIDNGHFPYISPLNGKNLP